MSQYLCRNDLNRSGPSCFGVSSVQNFDNLSTLALMAPDKLNTTQSAPGRVPTYHKHSFKRKPHVLIPQTRGHRIVYLGPPIYVRKLPVMEPRYYGPNSDLRGMRRWFLKYRRQTDRLIALQRLKPRFLAVPEQPSNTRYSVQFSEQHPSATSSSSCVRSNCEDECSTSDNSDLDTTAENTTSNHFKNKGISQRSAPQVKE